MIAGHKVGRESNSARAGLIGVQRVMRYFKWLYDLSRRTDLHFDLHIVRVQYDGASRERADTPLSLGSPNYGVHA